MSACKTQWIAIFMLICVSFLVSPAYASGHAVIRGQVTDTDGTPLEGVTVSVRGTSGAVTDAGGMYEVTRVRPDEEVTVRFMKAGYVPTQGSVNLLIPVPDEPKCNERDRRKHPKKCRESGHHKDKDKHHGHHDKHDMLRLSEATLVRSMLRAGAVQSFDSAVGGTLTEGGFRVSIPADSLTADGMVDIAISPVDVSTAQISGVPGDFSARTASGSRVTLESFSMADYTLTQNGRPVNLKPGASAEIELLLPENTALAFGETKPLWYFDTGTGLWHEEGTGTVGESTAVMGRLAVFATVQHFTFWNSDQPLNSTAVAGRVLDLQGNPLSSASVEGFGVNYAGHSYSVPTDANGNYCIQVRTDATSALTASLVLNGITLRSVPLHVTTGTATSTCADGAALQSQDIVIATALSCVAGDVTDANGQPVADAIVLSSAGTYTTTNANGAYQLTAPEQSQVVVYSSGYATVSVTTPAAGSPCVTANLRPAVAGENACLSGYVYTCSQDSRYDGLELRVRDPSGIVIGAATTDANGEYCIDGLPANLNATLEYIWYEGEQINTGSAGGSCAARTCNAMAPIDAYCW